MNTDRVESQECISYQALKDEIRSLKDENQSLKARLEEAEELQRAISEGDLDALVLNSTDGDLIFTLDSADRAYRTLVETMNEGTATLGFDGTILYCNSRFAELLKMPTQAITGTSIYHFIAQEDLPIFRSLLEHNMSSSEVKLQDMRRGRYIPVYMSISSLRAEHSKNAWCLVVTDLTEQKKNEEIVASERLARSIIEQCTEAIIVCDTSGRIIRCSESAKDLLGFLPQFQQFEDLVNLQLSNGEDAGESILPVSIFPVSSTLKGYSIKGVEVLFEPNRYHKLIMLLNSTPLRNANEDIIGCVLTLTDITERKKNEEELYIAYEELKSQSEELQVQSEELCEINNALRESEERFRTVVKNVKSGVALIDETGRFAVVNPLFMDIFGLDKELDILNVNSQDWSRWEVYDEDGKLLHVDNHPVRKVMITIKPVKDQLVALRNPGANELTWLIISAEPILNEKGQTYRVICTYHDITKRRLAEEALRESEERFKLLSESNALLLSSKEPERTIQVIAEKVMRFLNCDVFFNYVFEKAQKKLHLNACSGISAEAAEEIEWLDVGSAICGCVALDGYRIVSYDVQNNGDKRADLVRSMGIQAYACQPLHVDDRTVGTLSFGTKGRKGFTEEELALMSTVADQVSVAFKRKLAEDELREAYEELQMQSEELEAQAEELCQTNESLRESEERERAHSEELKVVLDSVPAAVWIAHDSQALYITGNKLSYEWLRVPDGANVFKSAPEEKRPESFRIFKDGVEIPPVDVPVQMSARGVEVRDYEFDFVYPDGGVRNVLGNARPLYDSRGNTRGSVSAFVDISERKRMEKALKKANETLEDKVKERTAELEKAYISLKGSEQILSEAQKIAHIGSWEWSIASGKLYWSDEIYNIFGLIPQEFNPTYKTFLNFVHPEDQEYVENALNEAVHKKPFNIEFRIILSDSSEKIVIAQGKAIFDEKNNPIILRGMIQDITDRSRAEKALLKLNQIRIKEIHHRIKNNLQVISSMLDLQAERFREKDVLDAFKESQNRVISMALIHEELYKGEETDKINFSDYIEKLAEKLFQAYKFQNKNIHLSMDLDENTFFDMDTAIPLGIIVNELVSNSLKHAFNGGKKKGEIRIQLCEEKTSNATNEHIFNLSVSDNGNGFPKELEVENAESLGLQLVNILVDQLDGKLELNRENSTEFKIRFAVTEETPRYL